MSHQDQHLIETTISSKQSFQGSFMQVMHDVVQLPDGSHSIREYIQHPGAVAVLAMDDDKNLIMERQYRYCVRQVIYEIPAGKLDPDEDELTCGKRELLEETGYEAKEWIKLGECLPCIGYSNERIIYYLAKGLTYSGQKLDVGEFLEVVKQPLEEIYEMAISGQIPDSKTLSGLMLLYGYQKKQQGNV